MARTGCYHSPLPAGLDETLLMHQNLKKPIMVDGEPPSRGLRLMCNSYLKL